MKKSSIVVALMAGLALHGAAHADLLTNGSFELPAGTGYATLPGGVGTITGWTTVANGVEWFNATSFGGAADGVMVIDLANYVYTGGGIEQTFATVVGQNYDLAFSLGTLTGSGRVGTAHIDVTVAGNTIGYDITNLTPSLVWVPVSLSFQAIGDSTTLRFSNTQNPFLHFANVDAVSVMAAVPEPETYAMLMAGLGVIGFVGRRRKAWVGTR